MRNINPLSDHVIASVNGSTWSVKVVTEGQSFIFEETENDMRLVSSGGKVREIVARCTTLTSRATLRAREEYAQYLTNKEIA